MLLQRKAQARRLSAYEYCVCEGKTYRTPRRVKQAPTGAEVGLGDHTTQFIVKRDKLRTLFFNSPSPLFAQSFKYNALVLLRLLGGS